MANAGVKMTGEEAVREILRRLEGMPTSLNPEMKMAVAYLQEVLQKYPPKLPNQKYIRTFKLRDSWQAERAQVISKSPEYNTRVMDAPNQAPIHQGRWQTVQSVAADEDKAATDFLAKGVARLIRG